MVDEDPGSVQHPYLKRMKMAENLRRFGIKILVDEKKNNRVIILSPRLEEWIIEASKESKINLKKHNLPKDGNKLHKIINLNLERFEGLLDELIEKSERIRILKRYLLREMNLHQCEGVKEKI